MINFAGRLRTTTTFSLLANEWVAGVGFIYAPMLQERIYPYVLMFIQLTCLVFILSTKPLFASGYAGILVESVGIFIGFLAIFQMGIGNFNISPRNKPNAILVDSGIYSAIRHPMYFAQVVAVIPLIIDYYSIPRLLSFLVLIIALLLKMKYEESHLVKHFDGYSAYIKRTKRVIPFIYWLTWMKFCQYWNFDTLKIL